MSVIEFLSFTLNSRAKRSISYIEIKIEMLKCLRLSIKISLLVKVFNMCTRGMRIVVAARISRVSEGSV